MPRAAGLLALLVLAGCSTAPVTASGHGGTTSAAPVTAPPTTGAAAPAGAAASWTTYGGSPARLADDTTDPPVSVAPAEAWRSPTLDGAVYGEPLVAGGLVYVATENDTVDALDAGDGHLVWSRHLADPVPAGWLPCGDISPAVGITSTMVFDPASGDLVASAEEAGSGRTVSHHVVALDGATGQLVWDRQLQPPGGWDAPTELQRAALALDGGSVVVGFGGNEGDCGDYHGWLFAVPVAGAGPVAAYRVPTAREGAIWAPAGVTVDPVSGTVYAATGNGSARPGQPFDHGDAVVALSAGLDEQQVFAPSDWAQDNAADADLGSTAPVLVGDGHLVQVGKQATAFLLAAGHLGGIGGQLASVGACPTIGGLAAATTGGDATTVRALYVPCDGGGGLAELTVGPSSLSRGWTWHPPAASTGSPTVARGAVWVVSIGAAPVLYGIDPGAGTTCWRVPLALAATEHFASVTAAAGLLLVAGSGQVEALR